MRTNLLCTCFVLLSIGLKAQVTQINNNNSLQVISPITSTKAIAVSSIDSSIWTTDGTLAGTVQLATSVKYEGFGFLLSGKFIFRGSTPATGSEIYTTDGTAGGTVIVKDVFPGTTSSNPGDFSILNGFIFFSARTAAEGRELWKTDGTAANTTLLKDIVPGPDSSNNIDSYNIASTGTYLLFAANTAGSGVELWKSDGTTAGTNMLKEINTGNANADSSNPRGFYPLNGITLFAANDGTHGEEIWKTDGTAGGTILLKDINPGTDSSTYGKLSVGPFSIPFPVFLSFHTFNNKAYFQANDGTSTGEVWSTDGTPGGTTLLKDIVPGTGFAFDFVIDGVNLPGKFIFPVSDADAGTRAELWQSDGTPGGTVLFKAFTPVVMNDIPEVFVPFNFSGGSLTNPLFQGNKFFFVARDNANGNELWVSDGTLGGTSVVKDIKPGSGSGLALDSNISYLYTSTTFFFAANDGTTGNELWKTDGTSGGTSLVKDINDADPQLSLIFNGKIFFTATDGDDPNNTDLFVVDGIFNPLPVKLTDFTVTLKGNDGLLQWKTQQEINSKDFTVQRSFDAQHFDNIGIVNATGTASNVHAYSFTDVGIAGSGKDIVYYRLAASDKDGKTQNTNIISLKLKGNSKWSVRLLSNPVQNNPVILLSGSAGLVQFSIRDITGKTVYTNSFQNVNGQISLPANLQKGMYILSAETNNERQTIKFVKQ